LLTVISDFGVKGFPISGIAKRWSQIWPLEGFPAASEYLVERVSKDGRTYTKKARLLEFLKFKAGDVVEFSDGGGGVVLAFYKKKVAGKVVVA